MIRGLLLLLLLLPQPAQAAPLARGSVTAVAIQTIYIRFGAHAFRVGDTLQLTRRGKSLGVWKIIAVTSSTVSATHLSGPRSARIGDSASGQGSRVERKETPTKELQLQARNVQQLWSDTAKSIGPKVRFRGVASSMRGLKRSATQIELDLTLQYLGVFSRGSEFQTALFQSRMELSDILGSGFWHRHLIRVRYDFADNRDAFQRRYRPNLEVYQFSAGYKLPWLNLGLGRIAQVPSEIGLVDGIRAQIKPLDWLSLIAYGGLAPDERTLGIRVDGGRYGLTVQFNPTGLHKLSRVGFAGQLESGGKLDRHFVFAETQWQFLPWLDVFARGVVDVVLPENDFSRTAPELTAATLDLRISPLSWLSADLRYDAYRPALHLSWLQEFKRVLPADAYRDYFNDEMRHSVRGTLTLQKNEWALRGGLTFDYMLDDDVIQGGAAEGPTHHFVAGIWAHWYQIMRLPLRLSWRYSYSQSDLFLQGHRAFIEFGGRWSQFVEASAGYSLALYLLPEDIWQLENTVKADVRVSLPLGFHVGVSGQVRFGAFDRGLLIFAQLGWRLQR